MGRVGLGTEELQADGREALRREAHAVHESAFAWALTCCRGRRADAEEVLQDAYAKVISGRARFHGRSTFKTWLFGVIRVTASEHRRSLGRVLSLSRWKARLSEPPAPPADQRLDEAREARALREAMSALPERQSQVLHLVFYDGLTVEEAALAMDVSVGTARTHYHRAKETLRARLGASMAQDGARNEHERA